mgnify:CR=1 FL=1|uniref:RING-type domain-containing protein n=1 Tax=viral metagenome TaxID=1070528 RepID=A0A6C0CBT3_9ZZZZ
MDTSRNESIKRCIYNFCDYMVKNPHCDKDQFPTCIYWLKMAEPKYGCFELSRIRKQMLKIVPGEFKTAILATHISSDYILLAKLSINGNYKANCPICSGEEIRDVNYYFPHNVFPCGHSICDDTCFNLFKKTNNVNNPFPCPICRQQVTRIFDSEKVKMDQEFYDSFITDDLVFRILYF